MTEQSDTPQPAAPACYATFLNGKIEYSELCVADHPGDFETSEYDSDIEIVALYSESVILAERAKSADLERQLTQARKENEGLRVDAERYRWLRVEHQRDDPICHLSWKRDGDRNGREWCNTHDLDAAVDAARMSVKPDSKES